AGDFSNVGGAANLGVAQLNADGSLDSSFHAAGFTRFGSSTSIRGLAAQNDGKILVAGRFLVGPGVTFKTPLVRLNADGNRDTTYMSVYFGFSGIARDLVLQPDGKAVAAITNSVYRFDTTGLLDNSFVPPSFLDTTYSSV